ncbi:MAG: thioredoxin family protein [Alphaproteobacteria bacterium]|nr:thioredoxin family protein [Alphaproteobacteria bacterium]MBL7097813.1 thioredoxin family protein [Alphaproteobacteria bacterium]
MKRIALTLAALLLAAPAVAVPAPKVALQSIGDLPVVERAPYDEVATPDQADAAVKAAFDRAKKSHRRVLIDLGGNWCGDCIVLSNLMQLPDLKPFVEKHFEVVVIDVGRFNKNLQVPARFGFTQRLIGVPTIIIATPDGKLVNGRDVFAMASARDLTPQAIADWLAKYAA